MQNSSEVMTNDPAANLRYVGASPNNYITFNNELWRIIGIFNGQVKIIQDEAYNSNSVWDPNSSNGWNTSPLQTEFNTTYLNRIDETSKSWIDQRHIWDLGGMRYDDHANYTRINMYNFERSITTPSSNPTTWTGAIGLMYPSDYGYATSSTNTVCDTTSMYNWISEDIVQAECRDKNWLYKKQNNQWTIIPASDSGWNVFYIHTYGHLNNAGTSLDYSSSPVLYLKSNIRIMDGEGTKEKPFQLIETE